MSDIRSNIFKGDSYYTQFVQLTYVRLMSRKWVSYSDIMAEHLGLSSSKELPCNVSNCNNYGELKKAFRDLRRIIAEKVGRDCIVEEGNNRNKLFKYVGYEDDPLAEMRTAMVINDLKLYWQFCQDSAGFFPTSWLEYFFHGSRDLIDIKNRRKKGEQVLCASLDRMLTNIELLPSLYVAIMGKQPLLIKYKPYEEGERVLSFHPHYLKEYNGRWYLFGHADGFEPEFGYNIAIDRIVGSPRELYKIEYIPAPAGYYKEFFSSIVGVSHLVNMKVEDIRIRAHTYYIFKLMETKKLHHSQITVVPFEKHEDGEYGEFSVSVEINNEFIGLILQMGAGLEIVAPDRIREIFKQRVYALLDLYK